MKNNEQLVNNIAGQLKGINKMIEEGRDCGEVITQIRAVKAAVNAMANRYMEEHLEKCVKKTAPGKEKEEIIRIFNEIIGK
jgi:DNA-binding FrmR family transcriptional regulator